MSYGQAIAQRCLNLPRVAAGTVFAVLVSGGLSCGPGSGFYELLNAQLASGRYVEAYRDVKDNKSVYSKRERLLYHLDLGITAHHARLYKQSNKHLGEAEELAEKLYTKSLAVSGASFVVNDYVLPYRGEDFERALIHLFMALNYVGQDKLEEALVEARKLDSKLHAMSLQYGEKSSVYKEDAFIRFVSGLLYEMGGKLDDAVVDYTKSEEIYCDYERNYGTRAPNFVIESLLSACDGAGFQERVAKYRARFPGVRFLAYEEKRRLGEILVIHYHGRSPVKQPETFQAEIDTGLVMDVAYPAYRAVPRSGNGAKVSAVNAKSGQCQSFETETMENIEAIALRTHQNRIPWLQAKALARVKAQYILVREQTRLIQKEYGADAAQLFSSVAGSLKEMVDHADTRSWQSLPAEIRVGRALVPPGTYDVRANLRSGAVVVEFDRLEVGPGQKKFLLLRSVE